jgi:hypothetical protein
MAEFRYFEWDSWRVDNQNFSVLWGYLPPYSLCFVASQHFVTIHKFLTDWVALVRSVKLIDFVSRLNSSSIQPIFLDSYLYFDWQRVQRDRYKIVDVLRHFSKFSILWSGLDYLTIQPFEVDWAYAINLGSLYQASFCS